MRQFVIAAAILLAAFFVDALRGRVLSQADLLYLSPPWSTSRPPELTRPGNPLLIDVTLVFYPFLKASSESVRAGRLPLWNPAIYGGQPLLASFQSAVFSPFAVFGLLLPPADALLATAVAKLLVGGVGMFLFLRRIGLCAPAVMFGALAFLLNPFSVVWLEHPHSAVACWLPWLLWSVERLRDSRALRDVAALSAVTALTLVSGHPETAYKVLLLTGVYAVVACVARGNAASISPAEPNRSSPAHARRAAETLFGRCLPATLLGLLLASVQIAPFAEYLSESGIAAMRRGFAVSPFTVPPESLVTAFVPDFFGNPSRGDVFVPANRLASPGNYCEQQVYPGNVAWVLAAVGVALAGRSWRVRLFSAAGVVAALLMYGAPGLSHLFALIPLGGLSAPSRFGLLTIASVIVVAAHGLDALVTSGRLERVPATRATRAALVTLAAMIAVVAVTAWLVWPALRGAAMVKEVTASTAWTMALAAIAFVIVVLRARDVLSPAHAASLFTAFIVIDLFTAGFRFHPMVPRSQVFPKVPAIETARADRGLYRVAGLGSSLPPNTAMPYGLQDPRGYDGVAPRRYCELLGRAFGSAMLHRVEPDGALHVLDLLNVKYLLAGPDDAVPPDRFVSIVQGPTRVLRNDGVFPRAFLVSRARTLDDGAGLDFITSPTANLRYEAVVAEPLEPDAIPEPAENDRLGVATVVAYEDTRVEIATESAGRRLLVLADHYYPGWVAYVDGREARIRRAYHALRAVAVPAGRHTVRFEYEPMSLRYGAASTGVALCVWLAIVARDRRAIVEELKACVRRE